ncbi:MAG: sensor histidine kinase [Gemmatimonadota bacterium]
MSLSEFITENQERILQDFEDFARTHSAPGNGLDIAALRDDAAGILKAIALDLRQSQSRFVQERKGKGDAPSSSAAPVTSAERHGTERAGENFSLDETIAEYRALRASVLRLWRATDDIEPDEATLDEVNRFHEAIDQALAECIERYSLELGRLREERVAEAQRLAEGISQAKSDFLQIVSHEMRTPLNAISGYTSLLLKGNYGPMTPAQEKVLGRMNLAEENLLGVIEGILDFQRAGTETSYEMEEMAVQDATKGIRSIVEPIAREQEVEFDIDIEAHDARIRVDPKKLHQVLVTLILNAVGVTPRGGRVWLDYAETPADARLRVHDTGPGIPSDKLGDIFEAFTQVDEGLTREREGIGLGLTISRKLTEAMGGRLTAESELGKGSVFTVSLPRLSTDPPYPPMRSDNR